MQTEQLENRLPTSIIKQEWDKSETLSSFIKREYSPDTYLVLNFNKGKIDTTLANQITREFFKRYYQKYVGKHWHKEPKKEKLFKFCITKELGKNRSNAHYNILLNRNGMDFGLFKTRMNIIGKEMGIRPSTSTNNQCSMTIHIQDIYETDGCIDYCLKEMNGEINTDNLILQTEIIRED